MRTVRCHRAFLADRASSKPAGSLASPDVTHERDVGAFDRRAPTYASGFTELRWQRGTLVKTVVATRAIG